jgi:hypothetical protein
MPRRSTVTALPDAVKAWLDKSLVENNFSGYEALAEELKTRGYAISKSALHRYGSGFEATMANLAIATEQAKAIAEACPDDAGAMNDALIRIVQQKAFEVLMKLEVDPEKVKLTGLGDMIANLTRSSVNVKKFMAEVREKATAAAEKVAAVARKGGLTDDTIALIEREILGISR